MCANERDFWVESVLDEFKRSPPWVRVRSPSKKKPGQSDEQDAMIHELERKLAARSAAVRVRAGDNARPPFFPSCYHHRWASWKAALFLGPSSGARTENDSKSGLASVSHTGIEAGFAARYSFQVCSSFQDLQDLHTLSTGFSGCFLRLFFSLEPGEISFELPPRVFPRN